MRFFLRLRLTFRRLGELFRQEVEQIDEGVARTAAPCGVFKRKLHEQLLCLGACFAAIYALYALTPAAVGLLAVIAGIWFTFAVSRAWSTNEDRRIKIAKKLEDIDLEDFDRLPSLRALAFVSALQLVILLPALCSSLHRLFGIFDADWQPSLGEWVQFVVDQTYLKSFADWGGLYERVHSPIEIGDHFASKHLIFGTRILFSYILLQGIFRHLSIRRNLHEAVEAARRDPDMAILWGTRALRPLARRLDTFEASAEEKHNWMIAMATLANLETGARWRDFVFERLRLQLNSSDPKDEINAAIALGKLANDARVAAVLLEKLTDLRRHPSAAPYMLKNVLASLGDVLRGRSANDSEVQAAFDLIFRKGTSLLTHDRLRVCNRAAYALGAIGHREAFPSLLAVLDPATNAKLLAAQLRALAGVAGELTKVERGQALTKLRDIIADCKNDFVFSAVVSALKELHVRDSSRVPKILVYLVRLAVSRDWRNLVKEIERLSSDKTRFADTHVKMVFEAADTARDQRVQFLFRVLLDRSQPIERRCLAARLIHVWPGHHAEAPLTEVVTNDPSALVREVTYRTIVRIRPELAKRLKNDLQLSD